MRSSRRATVVFATLGLAGIGVGAISLQPGVLGWHHPALRWVLSAAFALAGVGLLAFAGRSLPPLEGRILGPANVPAAVLALVGTVGVVGSVPSFQPGQYGGLAGGLRLAATVAVGSVGGAFVLAGWWWFREGEVRHPLAVLAAIVGSGAFLVVHQQANLVFSLPALAVVAVLVAAGPAAVALGVLDAGT